MIRDFGGDTMNFIPQRDWECLYGLDDPFPEEYPPQAQMPLRIAWVPGFNHEGRPLGYVENGPPWDPTQPCMRCSNEKEFCFYWQQLQRFVPARLHDDLDRWLAGHGLGGMQRPKIPELNPEQLYRRPMRTEWYWAWLRAKGLDEAGPLDEVQTARYLQFQERRRLLDKDAAISSASWLSKSDNEEESGDRDDGEDSSFLSTKVTLDTEEESTFSQRKKRRQEKANKWHQNHLEAIIPPTLFDKSDRVPALGTIGHSRWGSSDMSKESQESYDAARRARPFPTRQSIPSDFSHKKEGRETRDGVEMQHNLRVRNRMYRAGHWTQPQHALPALLPKDKALFAMKNGPFLKEQPFRAAWDRKTGREKAAYDTQMAKEAASRSQALKPWERDAREGVKARKLFDLLEEDPSSYTRDDDTRTDSETTAEPKSKGKQVMRASIPDRRRAEAQSETTTDQSEVTSASELSSHPDGYEYSMYGSNYYSEDDVETQADSRGTGDTSTVYDDATDAGFRPYSSGSDTETEDRRA